MYNRVCLCFFKQAFVVLGLFGLVVQKKTTIFSYSGNQRIYSFQNTNRNYKLRCATNFVVFLLVSWQSLNSCVRFRPDLCRFFIYTCLESPRLWFAVVVSNTFISITQVVSLLVRATHVVVGLYFIY